MSDYDDDYAPTVTGHKTDAGYAFTVEVRPPSQEEISEALARRMAADYSVGDKLRREVSALALDMIREKMDAAIEDVIRTQLAAPRQPTDQFGTHVGDAKSFAQIIGEQVASWQAETVNAYDGTPKAKSGYSSDNVITRAEYLIRKVGAAEFAKQATEAVQAVRTQAQATITNSIKTAVAEAVGRLAK